MKKGHTLNGSVKSIKELSYLRKYDPEQLIKGNRARLTDADLLSVNDKSYDYYSVYDTNDQLTEHHVISSNDQILERSSHTHNKEENKNEIITYDAHSKLKNKILLFYDLSGNTIKTHYYDAKEAMTMEEISEYDTKGNGIKSSSFLMPDKELFSQSINEYDTNSNKVAMKIYSINGSSTTLLVNNIYIYDDNNLLIEELEFTDENEFNLVKRKTYTYNEKGDKIEVCFFNSELDVIKRSKNEYIYDEKNNWTQCVIYLAEGKEEAYPSYIIEREIEYY
ncbi:hypothetical protein [Aquimarina pacifica]|uniref:hypothetical protein n=1 Tax=Aquimarina pacifica TaxID=1296415 RepID=UPI00047067A8|nr:hypothetical protein [Aquimarina pacifica]